MCGCTCDCRRLWRSYLRWTIYGWAILTLVYMGIVFGVEPEKTYSPSGNRLKNQRYINICVFVYGVLCFVPLAFHTCLGYLWLFLVFVVMLMIYIGLRFGHPVFRLNISLLVIYIILWILAMVYLISGCCKQPSQQQQNQPLGKQPGDPQDDQPPEKNNGFWQRLNVAENTFVDKDENENQDPQQQKGQTCKENHTSPPKNEKHKSPPSVNEQSSLNNEQSSINSKQKPNKKAPAKKAKNKIEKSNIHNQVDNKQQDNKGGGANNKKNNNNNDKKAKKKKTK